MSKPSVGTAVTPAQEQKKQRVIKELQIVKPDSDESIFNIIFSENKNGSSNK
jgi:hypothetical protein